MTFFRILLTNLRKCLEKKYLLLRSKSRQKSQEKEKIHFEVQKCHVHRGTSCKITAQTDKFCGNESKIRMTSQIYRFFLMYF
jgi:hypothetical protein